jgi:amino acid adenylation domain-containing protein
MQINILDYFSKSVKEYPDRVAIVDGDKQLTFTEISIHSKVLAAQLSNNLRSINNPVAVYLPKSAEAVIADIGIIYSGNFYMNLDVKSPAQRVKNIIDSVKPALIITDGKHSQELFDMGVGPEIVTYLPAFPRFFVTTHYDSILNRVLSKVIDTDPLCIINTSGSTGTPKGVVLNHKSFIDFTEWAIDTLKIGDNEIIGSLSPSVFDIYSFELCMMMSRGSTIVIIPDTLAPFPVTMLELMKEQKVSFIFWVPSIMVNIANMDLLSKVDLKMLKTVWFAGEVFPTKQFNYWRRELPFAKFVNLYGPIEITLDCIYYIVNMDLKDDEPIPIGYPCSNTDILILKDDNTLAGAFEQGEICVRGTSLAMGYYNNIEKTASAFVQNPLNSHYPELIYRTGDQAYRDHSGLIFFKGRKDTLIKHMGYRIELAEIEHIIVNELALVDTGCVVYNKAKKEIVLFYEGESDLNIPEFRKRAASILPGYMVPRVFVRLDKMPLNTNGKIDRLMLNNQINDN